MEYKLPGFVHFNDFLLKPSQRLHRYIDRKCCHHVLIIYISSSHIQSLSRKCICSKNNIKKKCIAHASLFMQESLILEQMEVILP